MDNLVNFKRTGYCGNFRLADRHKGSLRMRLGARVRDLGGLLFIDLRDRTDAFSSWPLMTTPPGSFLKRHLRLAGICPCCHRAYSRAFLKNKEIPRDIEVEVTELRILAVSRLRPLK